MPKLPLPKTGAKKEPRRSPRKGRIREPPNNPPYEPRSTSTTNPTEASKGRVAPPTHSKCRN